MLWCTYPRLHRDMVIRHHIFSKFSHFSWFFSWSLLGLGPFWLVPFGRSLMGWSLLTSNAEEVYFFSDYTKISNIECISTHRLRSSVSKNSCENLFNVPRACTPHSASKSKRILQFQELLTKYFFYLSIRNNKLISWNQKFIFCWIFWSTVACSIISHIRLKPPFHSLLPPRRKLLVWI